MVDGMPTFSPEQAMRAKRRLRTELGLKDERISLTGLLADIGVEMGLLHRAGRTTEEIVEIIAEETGARIDPAALQGARSNSVPEIAPQA